MNNKGSDQIYMLVRAFVVRMQQSQVFLHYN